VDRRELWLRLAQRPRSVRFDELDRLLTLSGWRLNTVRGSHHVYRSAGGGHLSIPRHRDPVKAHYVRLVLGLTEEAGSE